MTKWLGWLLLLSVACASAQPKRIYIANDNHTDYMWSGDEETYRQAFLEMIDYYLDLADKTQGNAPEHQSRWHCDGSFWIWTYQHNRTPAQFQRLISRIKDGHISFPLNALVSTYGGTPTEAVLRTMFYAGSLERRHGFRVPLAIAMENQTLPYGLGALWTGSGATRTWKGICDCMTRIPRGRRPHDAYWWNAGDGSRLLVKWNSMFPGSRLGGYLEAEDPAKSIDFVENSKDFREAWPYPVIGLFGMGGDDLKTLTDRFVTVAKSHTTADRKVIVSNMNDFFDDFEATQAAKIPTQAVSFGNQWDVYTASIAELSSRVRRAVEKLRSAEAISTIVGLQDASFGKNLRELQEAAWMNLGLFWEHNWTADSRFVPRQKRAEWGRRVATEIESYVNRLETDAVAKMASMIPSPAGSRRFYAFNSLNWIRSDVVDIDYDGSGLVHVIDVATGTEVPSQLMRLGGKTQIRILATDLPSVGYKVFEVRSGAGTNFPREVSASANQIENSFYKMRVEDRGAISSLIDKTRGNREIAGKEDGRFFVNDLGTDPGSIEVENEGPVCLSLRGEGNSPVAHTTRITLFRALRRIDIRNEITENFDTVQAWNFSFNLKSPDVRHEEVGAILRA
ncbi:MAG: glycoside hydrolase, partial [Bryobacteraceae bacterium]|nr:glycoside hydrolase [Bryobacteraceae bacterium]